MVNIKFLLLIALAIRIFIMDGAKFQNGYNFEHTVCRGINSKMVGKMLQEVKCSHNRKLTKARYMTNNFRSCDEKNKISNNS